ncbi:hypothetical protein RRG08_007766 [Elysia crispata]|uniref:Uncharacterized protein n=1 Tax=Elysia crispata TaxID=231223 RepID=A0AAE1E9C3_9GAST|nr:hypothetical protein RRG08_007766 [Elysia crispata]
MMSAIPMKMDVYTNSLRIKRSNSYSRRFNLNGLRRTYHINNLQSSSIDELGEESIGGWTSSKAFLKITYPQSFNSPHLNPSHIPDITTLPTAQGKLTYI